MSDSILKEPSKRLFASARILRWLAIPCFFFGLYSFFFYSLPMYNAQFESAVSSGVGNTTLAYYNAALLEYSNSANITSDSYSTRRMLYYLSKAAATLPESENKYSASDKELAVKIKFLTANILAKSGQTNQAVLIYIDTLRLEPNHLYAKYNLELLLKPKDSPSGQAPGLGKGKGKAGEGEPQQDGQGSGDGKADKDKDKGKSKKDDPSSQSQNKKGEQAEDDPSVKPSDDPIDGPPRASKSGIIRKGI